jgi:outer membrane lipoprotein-sorting protein
MSRSLPLALLASAFLSGPSIAAAEVAETESTEVESLDGVAKPMGEGVEAVDTCMRDNLPKKTSKQTIDLTSTDRTGGSRTLKAEIHWQQENSLARTLMEVEAPPADRGSRYLWLEHENRNDTWVCLPELQRVRRIHESSGDGALFGSDFSHEDVQHVKRISKDGASKRLPDTTLDEREVYIVHADTSGPEGSAYDHIVYSIDKETCLPLQIEFFDTPENLLKLLKSDPESFTREGDGWVARSVTIQNLSGGTASTLDVEKIEVDTGVPDRMFTLAYLERRCR